MQLSITVPKIEGQICKIVKPFPDENPEDVYIVAEDPSVFDEDENIYVVNLKDLQKNVRNPSITPQISIAKNELTVIADNLEEYIKSWNN
jgi:hypothetical protein